MKIEGIVINSNKYQDSSLVCNILTANGLISFLAKGVNKIGSKNKHLLLDMTFGIFESIPTHNRNIFTGGEIIKSSSFMLDSFNGLLFINFVKEVIYKILTDDEMMKFYPLLVQVIKRLDKKTNTLEYYRFMAFLFDFALKIEGFDPLRYAEIDEKATIFIKSIKNLREGVEEKENDYLNLLKFYNDFLFSMTTSKLNSLLLI